MNKKHIWLMLILLSPAFCSHTDFNRKIMGEFTPQGAAGLATAQFTKPLNPATINNNGTQKISRAGYYFLTNDLMFHPLQLWSSSKPTINWQGETEPKSILCITTDNVVLDLNRKTISQVTDTNQELQEPNLVGIYIKPGLKNITIKNGAINSLSGAGVLVGANCQNIIIDNLSVINSSMAGIIIGHNPFSSTYTSTHDGFEKIQYFDPESCIANSTEGIIINNCSVTGTTGYYTYVDSGSTTQYVYSHAIGLFAADCKNLQIANSIFNSNRYDAPTSKKNSTDDPGGHYHTTKQGYSGYGVSLLRCKNGIIENSQSCNNAGYAGYGFHIQKSNGIEFIDCIAQQNYGEADPNQHAALLNLSFDWSHRYLGRAVGFMLKDASATFINCNGSSNKGHREAVGFWAKRDTVLTAPASAVIPTCNNATLFAPSGGTYTACQQTVLMTDIGSLILPNYSSMASDPPTIGLGYTLPTTSLYVLDSGSSGNVFKNCTASSNESIYLDAYGFLAEGSSNNTYHKCTANNNHAGSGTDSYEPGGLADYDNGVGKWSLAEYDRYTNTFTNKVLRFAAGFCNRSSRLPVSEWDATSQTYKLYYIGGDLVFLGITIDNSSPTLRVLMQWPESSSSIDESTARDNLGETAGPGVGILLNGADKNRLTKNWVYCNSSHTSGTTVDGTAGIGAHGGYGILNININNTALIMENYAFANQIVRPKIITDSGPPVVTDWAKYIEGANYYVRHTAGGQKLPIEQATIGDFSAFITSIPFSNYEWTTTIESSPYSIKDKTLVASVPTIFTS